MVESVKENTDALSFRARAAESCMKEKAVRQRRVPEREVQSFVQELVCGTKPEA